MGRMKQGLGNAVSLKVCDYRRDLKRLTLASEYFGGGFPRDVWVRSHKTGQMVHFVSMPRDHPRFSEDCWDGEEAHYVPSPPIETVEELVVYHAY